MSRHQTERNQFNRRIKPDSRFAPLPHEGEVRNVRGHCSQIVNLLKQPVPWPYFHMLNLLTFLVLVLVSYGLVGLAWWPISLVVHAIICLIFIGARCDLQP